MEGSMTERRDVSCAGAYSNLAHIFRNLYEDMSYDLSKSGGCVSDDDLLSVISRMEGMVGETLGNLGYGFSVSVTGLNDEKRGGG